MIVHFLDRIKENLLSIMFFRNDDVRSTLDNSLIAVTDLFIKHGIPITHAVEPANLTPEVIHWLLKIKESNPHIVEIMQHGYDHTIKNKQRKGEFGGQRSYQEQFADISAGKELMNKHFGDKWFECFNFPYAPYNPAAIQAVNDLGFKVFNSHCGIKFSRKLFYFVGHLLKKGYFLDHHVSWNLHKYPGTNLFELDMSFGFITKYLNEQTDSVIRSLDNMIETTHAYSKMKTIGVLLHHRYHDTNEKIKLVDDYLTWCKTQDFKFSTMENVYRIFKTH